MSRSIELRRNAPRRWINVRKDGLRADVRNGRCARNPGAFRDYYFVPLSDTQCQQSQMKGRSAMRNSDCVAHPNIAREGLLKSPDESASSPIPSIPRRLGNICSLKVADPRSRDRYVLRHGMIFTSGIGTTNLAPHERTYDS